MRQGLALLARRFQARSRAKKADLLERTTVMKAHRHLGSVSRSPLSSLARHFSGFRVGTSSDKALARGAAARSPVAVCELLEGRRLMSAAISTNAHPLTVEHPLKQHLPDVVYDIRKLHPKAHMNLPDPGGGGCDTCIKMHETSAPLRV